MSGTRPPYSFLGIIELIFSLIALPTFGLAEAQYGDFNKAEAAIGNGLFYDTHQPHLQGTAPRIAFTLVQRLIGGWLEK